MTLAWIALDIRYNLGYTFLMKTAISVPNKVFESAEQFAHQKGLSRSELYVTALERYLKEHHEDRIMEKLNEVYGGETDSRLDPELQSLQTQSIHKGVRKW